MGKLDASSPEHGNQARPKGKIRVCAVALLTQHEGCSSIARALQVCMHPPYSLGMRTLSSIVDQQLRVIMSTETRMYASVLLITSKTLNLVP